MFMLSIPALNATFLNQNRDPKLIPILQAELIIKQIFGYLNRLDKTIGGTELLEFPRALWTQWEKDDNSKCQSGYKQMLHFSQKKVLCPTPKCEFADVYICYPGIKCAITFGGGGYYGVHLCSYPGPASWHKLTIGYSKQPIMHCSHPKPGHS